MKYGLIAEKISHSFSAEIHKSLFGYDYELKSLAPEELETFMTERDFSAINVTIPYKESVIPYLDSVDETAKIIGAVNTVVNRQGKLFGFNTDVFGMLALIEKSGIQLKNKKVIVLGSGGTSKTACYVAEKLKCSEVRRVSRSGRDGCLTYDETLGKHRDADVIINTTPCGMYPELGVGAVDINAFPKLSSVIDVVYNPLRTKLVNDALKKGINAVGGLYMLVAQAAFAAELFVGRSVENEKLEKIFNELFAAKQNIVLIGMPGCGKTATGRYLAEKTGREFVDTDEEILKTVGKTADELIRIHGEKAFRDIESEVIRRVSALQGKIISTGGGAILREENVELLRENGRLYFLDRALDDIKPSDDRPLSSNRDELEKRFNERYEIYLSCCDKQICCVDGADRNADMILEDFQK